MQVNRSAKAIGAGLLLVGFFLYLVLVDLGVNAGRVHYGVTVDGFEIGGRTFTEAVSLLAEHGESVRDERLEYRVGSFSCGFTPGDIGWGPQPHDTAEAAMGIGRPFSSVGSIGERIDAWLGGYEVDWADDADPTRAELVVERCRDKARAAGHPLNEEMLRALFRRF